MSEITAPPSLADGYALFRNGKYDCSKAVFTALLSDPKDAQNAHAALGIVHLESREFAQAEKLFRHCHAHWGPTAETCYGLGVVYEMQLPDYARAHYEMALALNSKHTGAQTRLQRLLSADRKAQTASDHSLQPAQSQAAAPDQPAPALTPPARSKAELQQARCTGTVSHFVQHIEVRGLAYKKQYQVWNFVINRDGLDPVSIQMAGRTSVGRILDGDVVQLPRVPREGQVVEIKKLKNLSRNAVVRVK